MKLTTVTNVSVDGVMQNRCHEVFDQLRDQARYRGGLTRGDSWAAHIARSL